MSSVGRYLPHYTIVDYQQWEGDWELLEGIAIAMTPSPSGPHQRLAHNLAFELETAVRAVNCDAVVLHEIDWIVAPDTVVRPDVVLLCGRVPPQHIESVPELIVEVLSPSSRERDLNVKKELYFREGVAYYLVGDPDAQSLQVFARNHDAFTNLAADDSLKINICGNCQIELNLTTIFSTPAS